ncbi:hypothetical protein MRX96_050826 [Rhipicephalus microplus]
MQEADVPGTVVVGIMDDFTVKTEFPSSDVDSGWYDSNACDISLKIANLLTSVNTVTQLVQEHRVHRKSAQKLTPISTHTGGRARRCSSTIGEQPAS